MHMLYRIQGKSIALQNRSDHIRSDIFAKIVNCKLPAVHNGNNHRVDSKDISLGIVFHGNLGFAIRTKQRIVLDLLGQTAAESTSQSNGQRHQFRRLITSAAEHHALITGAAHIIIGAKGNIGRLGVNPALDLHRIRIKFILRMNIADSADCFSGNLGIINLCFCGDFPADEAEICGDHGFAGNAGSAVLRQARIENRIGDGIRNLVGMTTGNTF